jgi:hypothetical protein
MASTHHLGLGLTKNWGGKTQERRMRIKLEIQFYTQPKNQNNIIRSNQRNYKESVWECSSSSTKILHFIDDKDKGSVKSAIQKILQLTFGKIYLAGDINFRVLLGDYLILENEVRSYRFLSYALLINVLARVFKCSKTRMKSLWSTIRIGTSTRISRRMF